MDVFMNRIEQILAGWYVIFGAKALIENFVETGSKEAPSKFDFGPINTMITSNYVNGTRFRLSGMTTGNLHPHWSFSGYGAYGTRATKWFYSRTGCLLFSTSASTSWGISQALPRFPVHLRRDVSYGQVSGYGQGQYVRGLEMDYRRPDVVHARRHPDLRLETNTGFSVRAMARHRNDQPAGMLQYWKNNGTTRRMGREEYPGARHHHHRTRSDPALLLPAKRLSTQATPCSCVAWTPHVHPSHTVGLKGVLGGEITSTSRKPASVNVSGSVRGARLDVTARAGAQWNTVPFRC